MPPDILDQLGETPVPPPPKQFDSLVHERLNRRLTVGHVADLAFNGFPYAALHFGRALLGLIALTTTGRMEGDPKKPKK